MKYRVRTMPVQFEDYDEEMGRLDLSESTDAYAVLSLLATHPDLGFTPKEIHGRTGVAGGERRRRPARQVQRGSPPSAVLRTPSVGPSTRGSALKGECPKEALWTLREGLYRLRLPPFAHGATPNSTSGLERRLWAGSGNTR